MELVAMTQPAVSLLVAVATHLARPATLAPRASACSQFQLAYLLTAVRVALHKAATVQPAL